MVINLGKDPWILIALTFLEVLFILLPALIASKVEKKTFKEELIEMGFQKNKDPILLVFIKISTGIGIGILFFFLGGYLIFFFRIFITESLFGTTFVKQADEGAISTQPIEPDLIQLIIIIIIQILIIGICEEAFFRAFIIKKCNIKLNLANSIIISSVFFSLYHVPPFLVPFTTTITYFGYYFAFGILLSLIFIYFNYSIIPNSVAHSVFNILIIIL